MELVDAHAHLEMLKNLEAELKRARSVGVVAIIAVGSDLVSNERVLELARAYPDFVFAAFGIHPWKLSESFEQGLQYIERHIDECIAIGEVGLDFWIKKDRELQLKAFKGVLELAKRCEKPVILHTRGAWREAFELVRDAGVKRAVFHWYSGPLGVQEELLRRGYYISATPAANYSETHRAALRKTPLEGLLLETDSPVAYRGVEARPSDIVKTLEAVTELKRLDRQRVAEQTTKNVEELFGLEF